MFGKLEERFLELVSKAVKTKDEIIEQELVSAKFIEELRKEQEDLLADLKAVGVEVKSVYDLVNTKKSYAAAVPILLTHLHRHYHLKIKEGIVRALGMKEAKGKATQPLIAEYRRVPKEEMNLRWAIGNAVYTTVTNEDIDDIVPIVQDVTNGKSRNRFVLALGKIKSAKAEDVLIGLLDDADSSTATHAVAALGLMKSKKALKKLGRLLESHSTNKLMESEVIKAIRKIEGIKKI